MYESLNPESSVIANIISKISNTKKINVGTRCRIADCQIANICKVICGNYNDNNNK